MAGKMFQGGGDHEKNEQIKRWVQADPTQRKTTRLKKQVTFLPLSILSKTVSHGVVKGGGQDF